MKSFNEATNQVEYKSSLELKAIRYCDANPQVKKFSLEPFAIPYVKPTDGKVHRYFVDLLIKFENGSTFIVEIKSSSETRPPKKPKKITALSERNYRKALQTWSINSAKWKAAKEFADLKEIKFIFLTEKELN
ncbi:MAG: hypothetical protein KAI79_10145 [Bacteroidales bacterium]|nr:hypothetical protein [Bacteroidales bacterium]